MRCFLVINFRFVVHCSLFIVPSYWSSIIARLPNILVLIFVLYCSILVSYFLQYFHLGVSLFSLAKLRKFAYILFMTSHGFYHLS